MTMRAVSIQVCGVCHWRTTSKAEMAQHTADMHGTNWAPGDLRRSTDQREFTPCLAQTPWGSDFR